MTFNTYIGATYCNNLVLFFAEATSSMVHTNSFQAPQMPVRDHDRIWNHLHTDPQSHFGAGNGHSMCALDHTASAAALRPNDYPPSTFSNYTPTNSGPPCDPYFYSSQFPPDQLPFMPPVIYNQVGSSMVNPQAEFGRYKRKSPAVPLASGRGNTNGYYSGGSSSHPHSSNNHFHPKPMTRPHGYRSDNLLDAGEDSHRNVRRRYNHHLQDPPVGYPSSNLPRHYHSAGNIPGLGVEGQQSHAPIPIAPQGRILSSDPRFRYEVRQSFAGRGIINNTSRNNGAYYPNTTQSRTPNALPILHDPFARVEAGSNRYNRRSNPYRSNSSYNPVGLATPSETGGSSGMEYVVSSQYSRPLSITGRSSFRNGRTRSSYSRLQSSYDGDSFRGRWASEGAELMSSSSFYESRSWFDQHRDMRLDIDDMGYEELLALGERIGNVDTGLSEETVSGCLQETTYCISDQIKDDQEEESCAICLEEYKDQDKLGKLGCRHDFHVSCIKKWLLMKNACPICKAAAIADTPKEKQT